MTVHLFEPGGRGGVYQHSVAVARILQRSGRAVVLHTADDPEFVPDGVRLCRCVSWHRGIRHGRTRQMRVVASYLARTLPHLARALRRGDVLHVQGRFKPGLLALPLLIARARSSRAVLSPHNTFARGGGRAATRALRTDLRLADAVIAFSGADQDRLSELGHRSVVAPLVLPVPAISPPMVERWRRRWGVTGDGAAVVLFAGQLRPDKRLDAVIAAMAVLRPSEWRLAVVGEDLGVAEAARSQADALGLDVRWDLGWLALSEFVAAIAAADVVVCPYDVASQSGILDFASQLGTRSAARAVGGLSELATVTFDEPSPEAIAAAVQDAASVEVIAGEDREAHLLRAHETAYGA